MTDILFPRPTFGGGSRPTSSAPLKDAPTKRKFIRKVPGSGVIFTEKKLGELLYLLYPHEMKELPAWPLQLTVFFTHGNGAIWQGHHRPRRLAVISSANKDVKKQLLVGAILVDMAGVVSKNVKYSVAVGIGHGSKSKIVPRIKLPDVRYDMISVLAHELYHCTQNWLAGENEVTKENVRIMHELMKQRLAKKPTISVNDAYNFAYENNPLEQQAEFAAKNALHLHVNEVRSGAFDKYMPIDEIRYYIINKDEIFKFNI